MAIELFQPFVIHSPDRRQNNRQHIKAAKTDSARR